MPTGYEGPCQSDRRNPSVHGFTDGGTVSSGFYPVSTTTGPAADTCRFGLSLRSSAFPADYRVAQRASPDCALVSAISSHLPDDLAPSMDRKNDEAARRMIRRPHAGSIGRRVMTDVNVLHNGFFVSPSPQAQARSLPPIFSRQRIRGSSPFVVKQYIGNNRVVHPYPEAGFSLRETYFGMPCTTINPKNPSIASLVDSF